MTDVKAPRSCRKCSELASDDSDLCPMHEASERVRVKLAMRATRKRKRREKKCLWCPKRAMRGRPGCLGCQLRRDRAKTAGVTGGVTQPRDRIAGRTESITEGDGRTRERYRGKGTTGRMSGEAIDTKNIEHAFQALLRLRDGLKTARGPEVAQMPPIQRREALEAALSFGHLAARHIDDVLARNKYERPDAANLSE